MLGTESHSYSTHTQTFSYIHKYKHSRFTNRGILLHVIHNCKNISLNVMHNNSLFEVLMAMRMEMAAFWVVALCKLV
jgi:hypothetical protein